MSPRGRVLDQAFVRELAQGLGATIVCGRFEGVDERVIEARNLVEVSIGDYVLSGGEIAAMALLDAAVRLLPGVMGNAQSGECESFEAGLLEYPHYTRPQVFEGREIPAVLTSGDHGKIASWRHEKSEELTPAKATGSGGQGHQGQSLVNALLRLENAALLVLGVTGYHMAGGNWWLFALAFLVPDLSMAGYLFGPKIGATGYNIVHSWIGPALLLAGAFPAGRELPISLGLIWAAISPATACSASG